MSYQQGQLRKESLLAAGIGMLVGMLLLALRVDQGAGLWLKEIYESRGFSLQGGIPSQSLGALGVMFACLLALVLAIEGTPGHDRRLLLLATALVLAMMASPVLALWQAFWNPFVLVLSMLVAGVSAMVQVRMLDARHAQPSGSGDAKLVAVDEGRGKSKPNVRRRRR
ncbi:MAG: hypothetical protein Q7Q71_02325 [Verrucomicrobiota bacterium JB023]|nr:hypothetical protein [Verrucomicrobiota bacterium JB023]